VVFLALLNEGTASVGLKRVIVNPKGGITLPATQLTLNRSGEPSGSMVVVPPPDQAASGIPAQEGAMPKTDWQPGELLIFQVKNQQPGARCSFPIAVQIQCDDGCARTQAVSGALPNYLHKAWVDQCQPLKGRS
jgi:hypothetical protein